jgi:hypothetical protein
VPVLDQYVDLPLLPDDPALPPDATALLTVVDQDPQTGEMVWVYECPEIDIEIGVESGFDLGFSDGFH